MFGVLKGILSDHIHNTNQIFKMAKADLVKTYRGAALGWSWAIIKPCVTLFTYWITFEFGLRSGAPIHGVPFFLWLSIGIVPWFYMSEMLTQGTDSVRKYSYLVTKMKFPISVIPTFVSLSKLMVNLVLLFVVLCMFWAMGFAPTVYYLQLPLFILFSFIFFTLWAQFASLLAAISHDFANLVKSFITPIFWLSGILWQADKIKTDTVVGAWVKRFLNLNPVTFLTGGFRNSLVYDKWFWEEPNKCLYFACWLVILTALSLWAHSRLRKDIPDVL